MFERDADARSWFATTLYRGILGREPDPAGHQALLAWLADGGRPEDAIRMMLASDEYKAGQSALTVPQHVLPDLTRQMPDRYARGQGGELLFRARTDDDFYLLEDLIRHHRYYDNFGVWAPTVDYDKRVIAAIVRGLGAKSCFELGCFTGPVLTLLADAGLRVAGSEVSHLAFVLAFPNVRDHLIYGDLLDLAIEDKYDLVLAMDVLEHLNPLKLGRYLAAIGDLLGSRGFVLVNSPMFGTDDIFGTPFPRYVADWDSAGSGSFWRSVHCDDKGWPMHGHLVWASPDWWEAQFLRAGLVRVREIERIVHESLTDWFSAAPARQSLFVLARGHERTLSKGAESRLRGALSACCD